MFRFKMAAKMNFRFANIVTLPKFEKTTFTKELKNIWLKVEEHEHIFIFQIKLKKKYSEHRCSFMLIRVSMALPISFFFTKRCVIDNNRFNKRRKKTPKCWLQVAPNLMHLSVNLNSFFYIEFCIASLFSLFVYLFMF